MRRILALVCLVCMAPVWAFAVPAVLYDAGLMLRYQTLSFSQRTLFDLVYDAAVRGETTVALPENSGYEDTIAAMDALVDDCPELCALSPRYSVSYYRERPDVALEVMLEYQLPLSTQAELLDTVKRLTDDVQGDAWTRELILHDMLCDMAVYDLTTPAQATAYGALVEGRAGCEGYARALILMCRMAGIPSGMVTGTAATDGEPERHAWCVMSVGGVPAQTDPTWNDQDHMGMNTHWYFNLTDAQMAADHQADEGLVLPPCTDPSATWHARGGWVVPHEGGDGVILRAMRLLATEKTAVNLRFEQAEDAAVFVENVNDWWIRYNQENPDAPYLERCAVASSLTQGCVLMLRID